MIHSRATRGIGIVAAALALHSSVAEAKLVLETRFVSRTGGSEVQAGDVFEFDVFAVVTGRDGNLTNEALQSIHGRFISRDVAGGFLRGNLDAAPFAPYTDQASTGGASQDLDGDGDLDRGGSDPTNANGWFVARVSPIKGIPYSTGEPQEFKFASLSFTVTDVLGVAADPGDTLIQFEQRQYETAGLWIVDGQLRDWTMEPGTSKPSVLLDGVAADPDGFFFPPASLKAIVPEPASATVLLMSAFCLLRPRGRGQR